MSTGRASWEERLLDWAREGLVQPTVIADGDYDDDVLRQGYAGCERITRHNSRTFHLASRLLSRHKRRGIQALYAFCRLSDDLVDRRTGTGLTALSAWRRSALTNATRHTDPVLVAWSDTRRRFGIPSRFAEQLIDGVSRDLTQSRYDTFEELTEYCYGVASTVGLMAMHILGFSPEAVPAAVKLGVALQLTNILRDVGEDWTLGRLYLPQTELAEFGVAERDIERGFVIDRWRAFMAYQIDRTRQLYREAVPGIAYLEADGRLAVAAAAELYGAILDVIEANDYDVFNRRAYVGTASKLAKLPLIWWRASRLDGRPP